MNDFQRNDASPLLAKRLVQDERIEQAKKLILEAVEEAQNKLTAPRPPIPELKQQYLELLASFSNYRGGGLYFPYIGSGFGKGALVELMDGSVKYDMISGIGPHYFGHCHPMLIRSSLDAAITDTIMQGHLQQNSEVIELSEILIKAAGLDHCFLTSSGAMANENALKLAFQKKHPASRVLAFEHCFAGRTIALSQVTDKAAFREGIPSILSVDYIPFFNPQEPEKSLNDAIEALKTHLHRYPKQHAAFCMELIQGEGGIYPGTNDYFQTLLQIVKDSGIAIIADEVQTFARTPELFAFQYFGLEEFIDIVTIGKVSQVCATIYRKEFKPRPGLLSQTFTSSSSAIHASKIILQSLLGGGYFGPNGKIATISKQFIDHFERLAKSFPNKISGPFGLGALLAFTPLSGSQEQTAKFAQQLFEAGIISFVTGSNPFRIRFLPPVGAVTAKDIDCVMEILEREILCL